MQKITLAVLATAALMTGCAGTPKAPELPKGTYSFNIEEQCPARLKVGETVTIKVHNNPSTGYAWNVAEMKHLKAERAYIQALESDAMIVGAGQDNTFIFTAESAGEDRIRLYHGRTWEQAQPASWTCKVTVYE